MRKGVGAVFVAAFDSLGHAVGGEGSPEFGHGSKVRGVKIKFVAASGNSRTAVVSKCHPRSLRILRLDLQRSSSGRSGTYAELLDVAVE